jgi:hypothetical protein
MSGNIVKHKISAQTGLDVHLQRRDTRGTPSE